MERKPNIVITDWSTMSMSNDISYNSIEALSESLTVYDLTPYDDDTIIKRVGDADILLCNKTPITRKVMESCKSLKYIGLFATGYNNIDIQASQDLDITVCNAGEYSTNAVAQHVFAMILNHYSKVEKYNQEVKSGNWISSPTFSYFPYDTYELFGKTISIIGYGSIGKKVSKIADAFGMKVLINTRTIPNNCPYEIVSIEEAFKRADVVTLHCPLTDKTKNLVCDKTLSLMKENAILINTSRGGTVDELALSKALKDGKISMAYLDVLNQEPMSPDTPLIDTPNVVITPHVAWSPLETRQRLMDIVLNNLKGFLNGNVVNRVN
ncbi:MAG: D-2-hydroxyacid dehydrogenase [Oscillospiraceae bacterium]